MRRGLRVYIAAVTVFALIVAIRADAADDWEEVGRAPIENRTQSAPASSANHETPKSEDKETILACGEAARPAAAEVKSMITKIDRLWQVNYRAYETVAFEQPHSAPGGCIFYNRQALAAIMTARLDVNDPNAVNPLLWAIFAHETGHQMHHDFDSARASVSSETKELEADRFAGYTLEKLQVPATNLTPFWTMAGDEFGSGAGYKHGSSAERVAAFKQGWHLAEWNRPEDSASVQSALDEPVAPDQPDSAPQ